MKFEVIQFTLVPMRYENTGFTEVHFLHLAAKGVMPSYENGRHQDKYSEQEKQRR
jgi:hypothetical protein